MPVLFCAHNHAAGWGAVIITPFEDENVEVSRGRKSRQRGAKCSEELPQLSARAAQAAAGQGSGFLAPKGQLTWDARVMRAPLCAPVPPGQRPGRSLPRRKRLLLLDGAAVHLLSSCRDFQAPPGGRALRTQPLEKWSSALAPWSLWAVGGVAECCGRGTGPGKEARAPGTGGQGRLA